MSRNVPAAALALAVLLAGSAAAQDSPPVIVGLQPDPSDPGKVLLTYQDGWSIGIQGYFAMEETWIRGATIPPDPYGPDVWFEVNARDLAVEGGIPAPGLPPADPPPGLERQVTISGLEPETAYFIAVRSGVFGHSIPLDRERGWRMVTTGSPLPPTPPPSSSPSGGGDGEGGGGALGCGSWAGGAAPAAGILLLLLPGFRRPAEGEAEPEARVR